MKIWIALFASSALIGCATGRSVNLWDGVKYTSHEPQPDEEEGTRVELDDDEFEDAMKVLARDVRPFPSPLSDARRFFGMPALAERDPQRGVLLASYGEIQNRHLLGDEMTQSYAQWCERRSGGGDCLGLLQNSASIKGDGRYTLAMAIAMGSVWGETKDAFESMADPQALLMTVTAAVTMYMMLWALPEPVSKGVAATITALAIAYLGVDTTWSVINGWLLLKAQADAATSFAELRAAGERYGEVLGENAARVFVMLATAAIGSTANLAMKAPGLPGSAPASLIAEAQGGFQFAGLAGVQSVRVAGTGFTLVLAPGAMAMASQDHHIGTIRNEVSTARGGPWTPRLRDLFKRGGLELKDPENIVRVEGHKGPHPEEYHRAVFRRLTQALGDCRSVTICKAKLVDELARLAKEIQTAGTEMNLLVTKP